MLPSPPSSSQGPGQEAVLSHHVAGKQTPFVLPNLPLPTPITGSTHRPWTSPRAEPDHPSLLPLPNPHPEWAAVAVTCPPDLALLQLHHLPLLPSPAAPSPRPHAPPLSPAHLSTGCLPPSCVSTSVPLEGLCQENTTAPLFWLIHACLPFRPGAPSPEATAGSLGRFSPLASPLLSLPRLWGSLPSLPTGFSGWVSLGAAKGRAAALQQQTWGLAEFG